MDIETNEAVDASGRMEAGFEVRSEYGAVRVWLDRSANGPRLGLLDLKSNECVFLDPLELESLVWIEHADLVEIVDPSTGRWEGRGPLALPEEG